MDKKLRPPVQAATPTCRMVPRAVLGTAKVKPISQENPRDLRPPEFEVVTGFIY